MATAAEQIFSTARIILVVDWPSREVPETLVRAGFEVIVKSGAGPEDYSAHELRDGSVVVRRIGRAPDHVDLVYCHRPIEELQGIATAAKHLGATAIWRQSGRDHNGSKDPTGCWVPQEESRRARDIVEALGMQFVDILYIVDVVRSLGRGPQPRSTP